MSNPIPPTDEGIEPESIESESGRSPDVEEVEARPRRQYQPTSDLDIELLARCREYRAHVYQVPMDEA